MMQVRAFPFQRTLHFMLALSESALFINFCVALGIGLLVGAERERRKGEGPLRRSAGIRTFASCALTGFVAQLLGGAPLLVATLIVLGMLAALSYRRSQANDPGLTSEVAILLTCLLGGLSVQTPDLAAVIGIVLTALLAARERMHLFVRHVITEQELEDVIIFLAAALILLPLAPDEFMGPLKAINPHNIARFVVMVMSISALGYMAKRIMGPRGGMAVAGLTGGFISSTATILSMGQAAKTDPLHTHSAATGAMLSTISTMLQLGLLISVTVPDLLMPMLKPIGLGAAAASLYAWWLSRWQAPSTESGALNMKGHAFDLGTTLTVSLAVLGITVLTAGLHQWLGTMGAMIAAFLSGFVDAHATVASSGSLVTQEQMSLSQAQLAILLAVSSNNLSKAAVTIGAGGRAFAMLTIPGLALVMAAVWLGTLI